ncbi:MAG TPA: hypothetical protein VFW49_13005 [Fluviicoccus sp.]|nr:hypothetical protein [Fluviicoccus sp.]
MKVLSGVLSIPMLLSALQVAVCHADLQPMGDEGMEDVSGAGVALLPENFRITFDDTAYIKTLTSTTAPAFGKKAELIWYGMTLGAANGSLSSRGAGQITSWGTASNPWLLKVETINALNYSGALQNVAVMNYYAPKYTPGEGGLKYSFWGDVIVRCVDNTSVGCTVGGVDSVLDITNVDLQPTRPAPAGIVATEVSSIGYFDGHFQSQNIWDDFTLNGSRFSIFSSVVDYNSAAHTTVASTTNGSLGLVWLNRINSSATGKYRFSVAQSAPGTLNGSGLTTVAPTFNNTEGFYITDMDINMVVGSLHYQPVIIGAVQGSQNFQIELVRLPNIAAIYNKHYIDYTKYDLGDATEVAKMCSNTTADCTGATHSNINFGKVEFKNTAGATVDLGSAAISGMMFHHLKIRTCGLGGGTSCL